MGNSLKKHDDEHDDSDYEQYDEHKQNFEDMTSTSTSRFHEEDYKNEHQSDDQHEHKQEHEQDDEHHNSTFLAISRAK
jgi:hypothetical protein